MLISVPEHLVITAAIAAQTDFGRALQAVPGLHRDTAFLLWLMVDSRDPESVWAPLWAGLPASFCTGAIIAVTR